MLLCFDMHPVHNIEWGFSWCLSSTSLRPDRIMLTAEMDAASLGLDLDAIALRSHFLSASLPSLVGGTGLELQITRGTSDSCCNMHINR